MTLPKHLLVAALSGCALQLGLVTQATAASASQSHVAFAGDGGNICFDDDLLVSTHMIEEDVISDSGTRIHRAAAGGAEPLTFPNARDGVTARTRAEFVALTRNSGPKPETLTRQPIPVAGVNAGTKIDGAGVDTSPTSEPSTFALVAAGLGMIVTILVRRCRPG